VNYVFNTLNQWDEKVWEQFSPIYFEAFGQKGGKQKNIIKNMFEQQLCSLHLVLSDQANVIGFALTGELTEARALLIDYIAVKENYQNKGVGFLLVQ
jgi:predicted N-acetyltransferase YhbS